MKNKKNVGVVVTILFVVISAIFLLISSAESIDQINHITEYSYIYISLKTVAVVQLVFSIVILVFSLIAIIVAFAAINDTAPFNLMLFVIVLIAVEKIATLFQAIELVKMVSPSAEADAETIISLVLLFLAVFLLFIGMICKANGKNTGAGGLGFVASLFTIIVVILVLASSDSAEELSIVYLVILLLSLLINGIVSGVLIYNYSNKASSEAQQTEAVAADGGVQDEPKENINNQEALPSDEVQTVQEAPKSQTTPKDSIENNEDPVESLVKLKKLLDNGIITQEEYEEKRKKYVDKL